jgi:hypothetical protein
LTGRTVRDRASLFARAALQVWVTKLRDAAADEAGALRRELSAEQAHFLVQELVSAAERLAVGRRVAEEICRLGAVTEADWENAAERAAAVAATRICDLIADLGYGALPAAERPQVPPSPNQAKRRAFGPPALFEDLPALSTKPRPLALEYRVDWLSAFVQLGQDNLGFSGSREIGQEQNAALGRILDRARVEDRILEI